MKRRYTSMLALSVLLLGCNEREKENLDVDFDIPRTEVFPEKLSEYGLFDGEMKELTPAADVHLYELNSELFTDYAGKQRLVRVPDGAEVTLGGDLPSYPDGTILVKTFYFDADSRDPAEGRQIVETRLLVKADGLWNVATYVWNEEQTEASLSLDGSTVSVSWLDKDGARRATDHEVPSEVACVTCHQENGVAAPIGPKYRNLDREVQRDGASISQLEHMSGLGVLSPESSGAEPMVDYKNTSRPLEERARAYLDINCAHCHNPNAWERGARQELDLRYHVTRAESGIPAKLQPLREQLETGEMPFIGTTLRHEEGVELVLEYLDTL